MKKKSAIIGEISNGWQWRRLAKANISGGAEAAKLAAASAAHLSQRRGKLGGGIINRRGGWLAQWRLAKAGWPIFRQRRENLNRRKAHMKENEESSNRNMAKISLTRWTKMAA